jgi:hypothetical protein
MSTIQTQLAIVHLESGLNMTAATQIISGESSFSTDAVTVTTTDEAVDLGDIITPKVVCIKLVSGDPIKIGIGGSTYPFRLQEAGESTLLRLDVEGLREVTTLTTQADVNGSLNGKYLVLHEPGVRVGGNIVWPWFDAGVKASGTITYGTPALGLAATGIITFGAPANGDTIIVNGTTFTKVASSPGTFQFSNIGELEERIEDVADVNSVVAGSNINLTAATPGTAGNNITLVLGLGNTGTMSISGGTLTGGTDTSSVTVNGTLLSYIDSSPGAFQFSNISQLEALVEAIAGVTSNEASGVITLTADAPGVSGNEITLEKTGAGLTLSAATLTGGADTGATPPTGTFDRRLPITLTPNATADEVAILLAAALEADSGFVASANGAVVTIGSQHTGNLTASTVGTTGWTALGASTQEGAASPVVWLKSTGTSQIVVAVAPS